MSVARKPADQPAKPRFPARPTGRVDVEATHAETSRRFPKILAKLGK